MIIKIIQHIIDWKCSNIHFFQKVIYGRQRAETSDSPGSKRIWEEDLKFVP